jgi:hypothetical protein
MAVGDLVVLEEIDVVAQKRISRVYKRDEALPISLYDKNLEAIGRLPTRVARVTALYNGVLLNGHVLRTVGESTIIEPGSFPGYLATLVPYNKNGVELADKEFTLSFNSSTHRSNTLTKIGTTYDDLFYFACFDQKPSVNASYGIVGSAISNQWVTSAISSGKVTYAPETTAAAWGLGVGTHSTVGSGIAVVREGVVWLPTGDITGGTPSQGDYVYNDNSDASLSVTGDPLAIIRATNSDATCLQLFAN